MGYLFTVVLIIGAILLFVQARKAKQKGNSYAMVAFIALGVIILGFIVFSYWISGAIHSLFN